VRTLADKYRVTRNFQRSRRVDADVGAQGLQGYVLNASAWRILQTIADDLVASKQRAFTWTGPYGSGKSSLALLLAALLGSDDSAFSEAKRILGKEKAREFDERVPRGSGWLVVRAVGRREDPIASLLNDVRAAIAVALGSKHALSVRAKKVEPNVRDLVDLCVGAAREFAKRGGGLLLIVDEMGKFMEQAAHEGGDIYAFQELAEAFSRLTERAVLLGILHQSMQDYSRRSVSSVQAEWAKVQGRFVDVPFTLGLDETVELISQALGSHAPSQAQLKAAQGAAAAVESGRFRPGKGFARALASCAPLNPVTALLLGPISRRRFGQNERSVFSFLGSNEVCGFSAFLEEKAEGATTQYNPHDLWDFLQLNLEPTILASPDGPKWSVAAEAVSRVVAHSGTSDDHVHVIKSVAILELFGSAHGIAPTKELLAIAAPKTSERKLAKVLSDMSEWSAIVFRRYKNCYGVFAGSDVDLDLEISRARAKFERDAVAIAKVLPSLPPVVASRYFIETGNLWIFDCRVTTRAALPTLLSELERAEGNIGYFFLLLSEDRQAPQFEFGELPAVSFPYFVGVVSGSDALESASLEVVATSFVAATMPALAGDAAARRELRAKLDASQASLTSALRRAFDAAHWTVPARRSEDPLAGTSVGQMASELCATVFKDAPSIKNELINKQSPSSAAKAARRRLMHLMVEAPTKHRLGISGEPAELGLYLSTLLVTGLHSAHGDVWRFSQPDKRNSSRIASLWAAFESKLCPETPSDTAVSFKELYLSWRLPPFGVREGVAPILALAFALAKHETFAVYVDGAFIPEWTAVAIDRLLQDPDAVSLRAVRTDGLSEGMFADVAMYVEGHFGDGRGRTALDITRPLVQLALKLTPWAKRTRTLSKRAGGLRDALLAARDPYLLLRAISAALEVEEGGDQSSHNSDVQERLKSAIEEIASAQDRLLEMLGHAVRTELARQSGSSADEIAMRANRVMLTTVEPRLKHFAQKLIESKLPGVDWVQQVASFVVGKPLRDWHDADIDRAQNEISLLVEHFLDVEALHGIATGDAIRFTFLFQSVGEEARVTRAVSVDAQAQDRIDKAADKVITQLEKAGLNRDYRLAALAAAFRRLGATEQKMEPAE
jgi:hypothetical protein